MPIQWARVGVPTQKEAGRPLQTRMSVPSVAHVFGGCLSSYKTFNASPPLGQCSTWGPRLGSEMLACSQYTLVAWLLTTWMDLEGSRCQPGISPLPPIPLPHSAHGREVMRSSPVYATCLPHSLASHSHFGENERDRSCCHWKGKERDHKPYSLKVPQRTTFYE